MARARIYDSADEAVSDVTDGSVVMVGGFYVGRPTNLVEALARKKSLDLIIIANATGNLRPLVEGRQIKKLICSSTGGSGEFQEQYRRGEVAVEMMPQGTLAERIRAGGAGIGGFYTPIGVDTVIERGKKKEIIEGKEYLFELPLKAEFALIRAWKADTLGNLVYRRAARNFNPIMATGATITIAEVDDVVDPGEFDPETIGTPAIYVDRILRVGAQR